MNGFPLGATLPEVKAFEALDAIILGATEIDMVINIGALKAKDYTLVAQDNQGMVRICHSRDTLVKVIIEAAQLIDEEKVAACLIARQAGADFVKTSTGIVAGMDEKQLVEKAAEIRTAVLKRALERHPDLSRSLTWQQISSLR